MKTIMAMLGLTIGIAVSAPAMAGQGDPAIEAAYCVRVLMAYQTNPKATDASPLQLASIRDRWEKSLATSITPSTDTKLLMVAGEAGSADFDQCHEDVRAMLHRCAPGVGEKACYEENLAFVHAHDPVSCQHLRANDCLHAMPKASIAPRHYE